MHWIYLVVAALFEMAWAVSLKISEGMTRPLWATATVVTMILSIYFLALAMKVLPVGTAYAIWTAIGALGVAVMGLIFFAEPFSFWRVLGLFLILSGVICLKVTSTS